MPKPAPKGFVRMEQIAAQAECSRTKSMVFDYCGRCEMKVGLHCGECKIQTTGCFCSDEDRFGKNEAIQRIIDRLGFEEAKAKLLKQGIWVPPGVQG